MEPTHYSSGLSAILVLMRVLYWLLVVCVDLVQFPMQFCVDRIACDVGRNSVKVWKLITGMPSVASRGEWKCCRTLDGHAGSVTQASLRFFEGLGSEWNPVVQRAELRLVFVLVGFGATTGGLLSLPSRFEFICVVSFTIPRQ